MNVLAALNLALALIEKLLPEIESRVKAGQVSAEEQEAARARYEALRTARGSIFAGPQWQPSEQNDGQV